MFGIIWGRLPAEINTNFIRFLLSIRGMITVISTVFRFAKGFKLRDRTVGERDVQVRLKFRHYKWLLLYFSTSGSSSFYENAIFEADRFHSFSNHATNHTDRDLEITRDFSISHSTTITSVIASGNRRMRTFTILITLWFISSGTIQNTSIHCVVDSRMKCDINK